MTDFRALCAELHAAFNTYAVDMKHHDLLERARALLAEPEAEGPNDEEIISQADKFLAYSDAHMGDPARWEGSDVDLVAFTRHALSRWGRPAAAHWRPSMTNLSPAAQAVLNAAEAVSEYGKATPLMKARLAAALRAAADQVVPGRCPPIEDFNEFDQGYSMAHITHRADLLAIAAELEGQ